MKFDEKYDIARPYTASFVVLRRDNKIAMVLRQNTGYMDDHYGLPAGKIEELEAYTQGAVREAKEEAGVDVDIENLKVVHIVHRYSPQDDENYMEWVDVYFEASSWEGEPYNAEPEKSSKLEWIDINNLPENVVPHQRAALKAISEGRIYEEYGWEELTNQ